MSTGNALNPPMNRYVVVSELKYRGERIDIPPQAKGLTVSPTPRAGLIEITYLNPLSRISRDPPLDDRVNVDKQ